MSARATALVVGAAVLVAPAPAAAIPQAATAGCRDGLPVTVALPTRTARALEHLGLVRATARARVRDLRVTLKRDGRTVARGSHAGAFAGAAPVRLAFVRRARPGRIVVVATGRRAGCAAKRTARRVLELDRHDLPVALSVADRDIGDGRFAVTVRRTGPQLVTKLRVRVLDAGGETIAERVRPQPLGEPLRIELAASRPLAGGRYWLLATAAVAGEHARGAVAGAIDLGTPTPPRDAADPAPPPGAVVQQVAVTWSEGNWQGADSASFSIPGIGEGRLVCRPDTQWLRVFPADRSRDVAMMLWTVRDWEGGSEGALREAQMTPFTGPDFNEGMNKFTPTEKRSHGTFAGVVGDGMPAAGTFGAGRRPTEIRLSWSWDFADPAAARCSATATVTSEGAGEAGEIARGLSLAWTGESGVPPDTTIATAVPGLGTVRLRCDPRPDGVRRLEVEPQAPPAGLVVSTFEGSERSDRAVGAAPYVVELPNNGLVEAVTPAGTRIVLASRWKVNDPDPAQNFCRLTGVAVVG